MAIEKITPLHFRQKESPEQKRRFTSSIPLHSIMTLRKDIDKLFDGSALFTSAHNALGSLSQEKSDNEFLATMDVAATADNYLIKVEVPGVDKEAITLQVDDEGTVTIKGQKSLEKNGEHHLWQSIECCYGSFQRTVSLPEDADIKKITARYKNGVLLIDIARKSIQQASTVKSIEINDM